MRNISVVLLAACLVACTSLEVQSEELPVSFGRDVRPILSENCFACHGPDADARQAELRLDTREGALAKLESQDQAAISPGDRQASPLWQRVSSADPDEMMPPPETRKALTANEKAILGRWIDEGAKYEAHWAYRRPAAGAIPKVSDEQWVRKPIDAFVLERLQSMGLSPSPDTDPRTLIRRLAFDLTGLPPTGEQFARYLTLLRSEPNDDSGYEQIVDELMASPRYGERMAIYWLDLVRYADTVGYHGDQEISVSPFRDYVIRAFNENMPFDQFSREQLAGDLLPHSSLENTIASGYNRLGMMSSEGGVQPNEYLAKYAAERVRNASVVWLAATMGCAECHDHKFDPFTQRDFYSFAAFFADIKEQGLYSGEFGPKIAVPTGEQAVELAQLSGEIRKEKQQLAELKDPQPEVRQRHEEKLDELETAREALELKIVTTHVVMRVEPRTMRVLPRGDWMNESGPVVQPAVPHFLPSLESQDRANRLDLANWIFAEENPLTARVFVNRIWRLLFGRGIVASLDDFGIQGSEPTHPELLDYLATSFQESRWNVKRLIKSIAMSSTYRQSSQVDPELGERDPYNELLTHQSRFRLDAEMIRDNALAVSGLLVNKLGGRSVKPYQPAGYYANLNFPKREYQQDVGPALWRRSLYTHWQRQFLHPSLLMFDASSREECTVDRPRSNTPLAALVLLNDPIYVEAARGLAERMLLEAGASLPERIEFAMREALGRATSAEELEVLTNVYDTYVEKMRNAPAAVDALNSVGERRPPENVDGVELAALTGVARVILNLHETITRY
jgi:hypothetical protein